MFRIKEYVYVDPLVVLMAFAAFCLGQFKKLMILYIAVFIHEAAHFAACTALKISVRKLRLMIYGANLRTDAIVNPVHSAIVAAAGPAASFFLICFFGGIHSSCMNTFKAANTAVLVLNIFPALPLDGGVFVKSIMEYKYGYIFAHRGALEITRIVAVILAFFGIIFVLLSKYNISLLVISAFLLYNLREERKKIVFLRRMIYTKEFDCSGKAIKIKHKAVVTGASAVRLTDYFGYNYICHFFVYDKYMNLMGTLTQSEIVDGIILHGADVTAGRLLGGTNEY